MEMIFILVSASVLGADLGNLKSEIEKITAAKADQIHFDVMDGLFVDNISFGIPVLSAIKKYTKIEMDVHLMIQNPYKYIDKFLDAGADIITFHVESNSNVFETIELIKSRNIKVGLSLRPGTPVETVIPYLNRLDNVLIMTVEPGFGGQAFMEEMMPKVQYLRKEIDINKYNCTLQVDGGINEKTAPIAIKAGADNLVSGSYLFNAKDAEQAIFLLKSLS